MAAITGPTPVNDKSDAGKYWNALRNFDDTPPKTMVKLAQSVGKSLQDVQADLRMINQKK